MEYEPDYDEVLLLPLSVNEWVDEDHPARFIHEYVSHLDLGSLGIKMRENQQGQPSYSKAMLLKLWLYSYFQRIRSCRKLEAMCHESMGAIWLAGRMTPDHNTLWRFWSQNRQLIENLFKQSVKIAFEIGLIAMVYHALDGTKITAASSRRSALHKKDLPKMMARLDEAIAEISEQIKQTGPGDFEVFKLELAEATKRREALAQALEQLQEQQQKHAHPLEPEAQMMMSNSGRIEWAYNAQAVVDDKQQIVVAADISDCPCDDHNLKPMLDQVHEQLGRVADRSLIDASYAHSEEQLAQVEKAGYPVVAARPKCEKEPYHVSHFSFDREKMSLVCPQGKALAHNGTEAAHHGHSEQRVHCFICRQWKDCPAREQCCGRDRNKQLRARTVKIGPYYESAQRQRQLVDPQTRREFMHRRLGIVEPVFGRLKWLEAFTRFNFRGKDKVRTQWRMLGLTINLRVLFKYWQQGLLSFGVDGICQSLLGART